MFSQRASARKAVTAGYVFEYPKIDEALVDVVSRLR
jgi:NAD dependent epimerase/dehydratase family enzyme